MCPLYWTRIEQKATIVSDIRLKLKRSVVLGKAFKFSSIDMTTPCIFDQPRAIEEEPFNAVNTKTEHART